MTATTRPYRRLIHAELVQDAALSVGGSGGVEDESAVCARDGLGRLVLPGTGLAGALIETTGRIFPDLLCDSVEKSAASRRLTSKAPRAPKRGQGEMLQSVWLFRNAHPRGTIVPEWRQGVGIRQATGTTASEKKALFDYQVVPTGTVWDFFLEIDTARGGDEAAHAAVLALDEWKRGMVWLGRSPARGTGWFHLNALRAVDLDSSPANLEAWPDCTRAETDVFNDLLTQGRGVDWDTALHQAHDFFDRPSARQRGEWRYLVFDIALSAGVRTNGFGLDALAVTGHCAGDFNPLRANLLRPRSLSATAKFDKVFDAPFVATSVGGVGTSTLQPFLPGGGLRGPLRHATSRLARLGGHPVQDPNGPDDGSDENIDKKQIDSVAALFGLLDTGSRILVRDAGIEGTFGLALTEHHAEDEFCGGVYGSTKFDRTVLHQGCFAFQLVVELPGYAGESDAAARQDQDLRRVMDVLAPALEMGRLGHLPIGGSKWRGAGWTPWEIRNVEMRRAGSAAPEWTSGPVSGALAEVLAPRLVGKGAAE